MTREVVVVSGVRTAIGTFGGALKDTPTVDLGALVVKEALARAGVEGKDVGHVVFGHVVNTEPRDMYLSRVAAINGGCVKETPAVNVNRLCGSGLQAIISASQGILLGDYDIAIGGGAENMSRAPYASLATRFGARMGDSKMIDMMVAALTDPFGAGHMGMTAENQASKWGISREAQDAFALESQTRAAKAIAEGRFKSQIVPVTLKTRKGEVIFDTDEHPRATSLEALAKMKPAFKPDGTVTAGNASGINDGAAFVVLADAATAARGKHPVMARLVAHAVAGVDASVMGDGPIPATRLALQRAGLKLDQIDVIEANEAFAAQALAVAGELGLDPVKTNPNGGAIALGHPVGATGAVIVTKLLHEMQRVKARYGLATMCIGGGQGITTIWERA